MTKKSSGGSGNRKDPPRPYEVGYGRPPVATRFKPGQSGNPKGRRKGKRNLRTEVQEQLQALVVIREGQRTRKVTKQHALVATITNTALKGDHKALMAFLNLMRAVGLAEEAPEVNPHGPVTPNDEELVASFLRRNSPLGSEPNGGDQP
jgi:hypothetical protein